MTGIWLIFTGSDESVDMLLSPYSSLLSQWPGKRWMIEVRTSNPSLLFTSLGRPENTALEAPVAEEV